MTDEIRHELTALRETVLAGFARVDRYFELQQAQFVEIRHRLDALTTRVDRLEKEVQILRNEVASLRNEVTSLRNEVTSLRNEFTTFRDWATQEFAEVRSELRDLRRAAGKGDSEIEQLSARVDRLERRWQNGSS